MTGAVGKAPGTTDRDHLLEVKASAPPCAECALYRDLLLDLALRLGMEFCTKFADSQVGDSLQQLGALTTEWGQRYRDHAKDVHKQDRWWR